MKRRFSIFFSVALCFVFSAVGAKAQTSGVSTNLAQFKETIANVRSAKTVDARTEAAEHLAALTRKMKSEDVTEGLVSDITSLLDSPDDSVRYWVATALGNIGPAAKAAIPKLERMLPTADCINGAITSASGIRYALIRMGVKPPPPPECEPIAG